MSVEVKTVPLGYAPVPPEMLWWTDEGGKPLSGLEIRVWCALAMHRNMETSRAFPSNKTLSGLLGSDPRSIKRAIARLIDSGFLLRDEQDRGKDGKYRLTVYTLAVEGEPISVGIVRHKAGGHSRHPDRVTNSSERGDEFVNGKEEDKKEDSRRDADASADVMKDPGRYFVNLLKTAGKEATDRERGRCFPHLKQLIDKHNATRPDMEWVIGKAFEAHMTGHEWWPHDLLRKKRQGNVVDFPSRRPDESLVSTAGYRRFDA